MSLFIDAIQTNLLNWSIEEQLNLLLRHQIYFIWKLFLLLEIFIDPMEHFIFFVNISQMMMKRFEMFTI